MKYTEEQLDKLIDKLAQSTRSPRGEYSAQNTRKKLNKQIRSTPHRRFFYWSASVAAAVLVCVLSWNIYNNITPIETITVTTLTDTKTVKLPDGSEVILNRYTSISYPERFKHSIREVSLSGEAYFKVARNEEQPFIVQAEEIRVKVLGTQFNVEAYGKNEHIKTTLFEGSVAVNHTEMNNPLLLTPHESAIYHKKNKELSKTTLSNITDEIAWQNGNFIFNNLTLKEIADELSNAFNIDIHIESSQLEEFKMTGRFEKNETLEEILNLLQAAGNFHYTQNNQTITITN